jgi:hypothetical protein
MSRGHRPRAALGVLVATLVGGSPVRAAAAEPTTRAAPESTAAEALLLPRPTWLVVAAVGSPLSGVELRARRWAPVELAVGAELVELDAAVRAVGRVSWFPLRAASAELGLELGAGGAAALRAAATLDAELGLRARAGLVPRVDADLRVTLLGYRGPSSAETGLVVAPRLRLAWWVADGFAVGAEGGALVGWSSTSPVAGLFVSWAPAG